MAVFSHLETRMPRKAASKTVKIAVEEKHPPTCGHCRWRKPWGDGEEDEGRCTLNPPVVIFDPEEGLFTTWPMVDESDPGCSGFSGNQ